MTSMITPTSYRTLINRGRKAGLSTRELYSAMAARPAEGSDRFPQQLDGNGFVSSFTPQGQRVYRPVHGQARP
jgi:hypothetical protein